MLIIIEPRISGRRADNIVKNLRFSNSYRVETEGFSGELWILWEENHVNIEIISFTNQTLHTKFITRDDKKDFFLTCIYGSPNPSLRQGLWRQVEIINKYVGSSKWMCIGDFNFYKNAEDKQGGASVNTKSMNGFINCCFNCNLMDLKFCGPKYTWKNGRIQERLD